MTVLRNFFRLIWWFFRTPALRSVRKDRRAHLLSALRQVRIAVGMLVLALVVSTTGYRMIEGVRWFDAYYMALVTLSTVGFGEVIPLSHTGRVFTSFLILFNIGFFTYAISTLASIFADGKVQAFFFEFNMMERIRQLKGHTVVCGFGRHAAEVCQELRKQKTPFVVIENDPDKVELLHNETDYLFIQADATLDVTLHEAGITRAAALVVTLPEDTGNLFIVISSRQLNPGLNIICRLNNGADEAMLLRAGANHVVAPERIGGLYMATLVNKPDLVEFFTMVSNMGTGDILFEEIPVERLKPEFRRGTIAESGIQQATDMPVVGVKMPDGTYRLNPPQHQPLLSSMQIVVLGNPAQIEFFSSVVLEPSYIATR